MKISFWLLSGLRTLFSNRQNDGEDIVEAAVRYSSISESLVKLYEAVAGLLPELDYGGMQLLHVCYKLTHSQGKVTVSHLERFDLRVKLLKCTRGYPQLRWGCQWQS